MKRVENLFDFTHCRFTALLVLLLAATTLHAQTNYSARVVEAETGEPLPLVGIYVSEDNGTLSNFDGEFSITAEPGDLLHFTCIGRRSLTVKASELPKVVHMQMLDATMSEVTVTALEGMLLAVGRQTEKAFNRRRTRDAQYFYRQTSVFASDQDIVEAFIRARSAVNLRELQFLTGRHGALEKADWQKSNIINMNLHHLLELGPMTKEAQFWSKLITPLNPKGIFVPKGSLSGVAYLQHFYDISVEELNGNGQQLYRFNLRRRDSLTTKEPIMTGALYVDRATMNILAFDGQVENLEIRLGRGQLRSATVLPAVFDVHIDYSHNRKFPEVADLSMQAKWGDFQTRTLLFNVEGQRRLRVSKNKKKAHTRENMLATISEAGYDSTYWANNEVVKRTAEEQAIAQGSVNRYQARLDSIAAYQASLPPLARMADRLERFGNTIPQEKVYVHMDNTSYFLGDTIWFAAYLRKTNTDTPSRMSRVLYAELWNHDGYLVERKLVNMQDGRGHGFFALPDTLYSGYFELRAYTRWQLNWGQTEHYHTWSTEYWFYNKAMAKDFFRDYEKLYSRVFPVYDKPKQAGDFYKDMTFRPLRRYFKSAPKPAELRLSLFPEGGNLVAGVPCRVAFEAATSEGEVREGEVRLRAKGSSMGLAMRNEQGEEHDFVHTENRGRGTFIFTPEAGKSYEVQFIDGESGKTVTQTIKAVKAEGVALQVRRDDATGDWLFDIAAAGLTAQQPLGVTVMKEGRLVLFKTLSASRLHFTPIPSAGIYQVTVFDSIGHIYADRLFFETTPELSQSTLMLSGAKEQYKPFERVDLDVTSAHLMNNQVISLAVRDATLTDNTFDSGNIMTEMLLSSEIKGFVPQPEYFFERDDYEHRRALDLLMLTQGWRRFNWQDMAVKGAWEITHPAEHTQIVTGTVNRYWPDGFSSGEDFYSQVQDDHERFMTEFSPGLSEQQQHPLFAADGAPSSINDFRNGHMYKGMAWNLSPIYERRSEIGAIPDTYNGIFSIQGASWLNNDYNVLSYHTEKGYRNSLKQRMSQAARHYIETGTVKKEVRIHAEFIDPFNQRNYVTGEAQTHQGRFQIDLPRFDGQCVFFLGASDTTKWHRKWEGLHRRKPHQWIELDTYNEYDAMAGRLPDYTEFYVRLNFPYPRWVKPYTYYQVHNAPLRDTTYLSPRLLTDGTHLLDQVTVRARHGGLRRIDYTKPAYVIDAYDAYNLALDAGLMDPGNSSYCAASRAAIAMIGDMGMYRRYSLRVIEDSRPGYERPPLERLRWGLLTNMDKFYIYTDYSPRREGDERYDQSNQPEVVVDMRRLPGEEQRVTYRDRRYILNGFAFQEDFYHPDYQRTPPTADTHDYRRTLYWEPELRLDANGRAHIHFYTGSRAASLNVSGAGMTTGGNLLWTE